jgi:predicted NBD/HSP70 family sugar kinase
MLSAAKPALVLAPHTDDGEFGCGGTMPRLVDQGRRGPVRRTQLTQYTGRKENAFAGSFSPDGKQIAFRLEQGDKSALAVVDRDGENLRLLTKLSKVRPRGIDWGIAR